MTDAERRARGLPSGPDSGIVNVEPARRPHMELPAPSGRRLGWAKSLGRPSRGGMTWSRIISLFPRNADKSDTALAEA
jgi:hypothetical protein